jgi:hypothetical protein
MITQKKLSKKLVKMLKKLQTLTDSWEIDYLSYSAQGVLCGVVTLLGTVIDDLDPTNNYRAGD